MLKGTNSELKNLKMSTGNISQFVIDKQHEIAQALSKIFNEEIEFPENKFTGEIWLQKQKTNKIVIGKQIKQILNFSIGKGKSINAILITAFNEYINKTQIPVGIFISAVHKKTENGDCMVDIFISQKDETKIPMEKNIKPDEFCDSYEIIPYSKNKKFSKESISEKEPSSTFSQSSVPQVPTDQALADKDLSTQVPSVSSIERSFIVQYNTPIIDENSLEFRLLKNSMEKNYLELEFLQSEREKHESEYNMALRNLERDHTQQMNNLNKEIEKITKQINEYNTLFSESFSSLFSKVIGEREKKETHKKTSLGILHKIQTRENSKDFPHPGSSLSGQALQGSSVTTTYANILSKGRVEEL
jgi:hypothetical protein